MSKAQSHTLDSPIIPNCSAHKKLINQLKKDLRVIKGVLGA